MELSTEETEINVTCNIGNLVSISTEIYFHRFAVDNIQTLRLEHMSRWAIAIFGSTCCLGNLVAITTENYFYYSGI